MNTCHAGTSNSSAQTRALAKGLAQEVGTYHLDTNIDIAVAAVVKLFSMVTGKTPEYQVYGGSRAENLALQNIQVAAPPR